MARSPSETRARSSRLRAAVNVRRGREQVLGVQPGLDALGQLDLVGRREQGDLADLVQVDAHQVGRGRDLVQMLCARLVVLYEPCRVGANVLEGGLGSGCRGGARGNQQARGMPAGGGVRAAASGKELLAAATVTPVAATTPATMRLPALASWGRLLMNGSSPSQARAPPHQLVRPTEASRNALTTSGSNWVPAQGVSSWRAVSVDIACL